MKAHRLNLREEAHPAFELEFMDGTVIHTLPPKRSQVLEIEKIAEKMTKVDKEDSDATERFIRLAFEFLSEVLSHNKEGLYLSVSDLRNKYLKFGAEPGDSEADRQQDELLVLTTVFSGFIEYISDIKTQKNL